MHSKLQKTARSSVIDILGRSSYHRTLYNFAFQKPVCHEWQKRVAMSQWTAVTSATGSIRPGAVRDVANSFVQSSHWIRPLGEAAMRQRRAERLDESCAPREAPTACG